MSSDKGVSNGFEQRSAGEYVSDVEGYTRAQLTSPMVRKAPTAAMARASLSGCMLASLLSRVEGRFNLAAKRRNNQQSHSE